MKSDLKNLVISTFNNAHRNNNFKVEFSYIHTFVKDGIKEKPAKTDQNYRSLPENYNQTMDKNNFPEIRLDIKSFSWKYN